MKFLLSLTRIAALLAIAFSLAAAGVAMSQEGLLYFPEKAPLAELVRLVPGARPWPSAVDFRALLIEPTAPLRGTLVVFHGNAGHAGHRAAYVEMLAPRGWRVLLAEYPGYGPRAGELGEASLVADAAATVAAARSEFAGNGGSFVVVGESLGTGVAAAASDRLGHAGIDGLLLLTPWDRLRNVADYHYPWLPGWLIAWGLRDRYDTAAHLAGYRGRVVVVVAERDRIVPADFGRALYAGLTAEKTLRIVAGGDHNAWVERTDDAWWSTTLAPLAPAAPDDPGK
jgi:uncharacterized protein